MVLPFAVAMLFGNLDVWYPLPYGALLLTILARAVEADARQRGAAIAIVAIAKLHRHRCCLWIAAAPWRSAAARRRVSSTAAIVTGFAIVGASIAFGGIELWHRLRDGRARRRRG